MYSSPINVATTTTLKFFAIDRVGNSEAVKTENYIIQSITPIVINDGAAFTHWPDVTLKLTCDKANDCHLMKFSMDNVDYTPIETFKENKAWHFSGGDGLKTIYVYFRNWAGEWSPVYSGQILLDTTAPSTTVEPMARRYNAPQTVTLTCADDSGSGCDGIRYTTDNTTPTETSPLYAVPIAISQTTQLTYQAKDKAGNREAVKKGTFIIDTVAPVTTASPTGGLYYTPQSVKLTCTDGTGSWCDKIYYTSNGTDPTTASPVYASPIMISETTTLTFFAQDPAGNREAVKTETYIFDTAAPVTTAIPAGGFYSLPQSVTLSCTDDSGSGCDGIYYTTDGAMPTEASSVYSSPINIATTTTLKFFARDKAGSREAVKTESYTIDMDVTPPTGIIKINAGSGATNNIHASLSLDCTDNVGCTQMQFSSDNVTYTSPENYAAAKTWTLAAGDGSKKVYAKFGDRAGNWSQAASGEILLDTMGPEVMLYADYVSNTMITLCLGCEDESGSGCKYIYYTTDGTQPTTESAIYSSCMTLYAPATLYYFATDNAGNKGKVGGVYWSDEVEKNRIGQ